MRNSGHTHVFRDTVDIYDSDVYVMQCPRCSDIIILWSSSPRTHIEVNDEITPRDLMSYRYSPNEICCCGECGFWGEERQLLKEIHRNVNASISRCTECRKEVTGWYRTKDTQDVIIRELI